MTYKTKQLVIDSILLALLIISSRLAIPIGMTVISMQILMVFVIILLLDIKNATSVIVIYLVIGFLFSLPVFTQGGGLTYIYNPTCGFLFGFLFAIIPTKILLKVVKVKNDYLKSFIASLGGLIIVYVIGILYAFILLRITTDNANVIELIKVMILPFILIDIFKLSISSLIYSRLKFII